MIRHAKGGIGKDGWFERVFYHPVFVVGFIIAVLAMLIVGVAHAADAPTAPVEEPSVVLTAQQFQLILNTLADRDPVIHMLLLEQRQQADARATKAAPPPVP